MKQLLQNVSTGEITLDEVPAPARGPASLLVATRFSVISAGTERAASRSAARRWRARPAPARTWSRRSPTPPARRALRVAYAKVRGRLGEPNPLGLLAVRGSCSRRVTARRRRRATSSRAPAPGCASHAEVVSVPRNLVARVPAGVAPEDARLRDDRARRAARRPHRGGRPRRRRRRRGARARRPAHARAAGLGGLRRGRRRSDPARVALARAARHLRDHRARRARGRGRRALTAGRGADAVLVAPRRRARRRWRPRRRSRASARSCCVVGDVAIESPRTPLFAKELRLVVSRSYGPGRYDPSYEARRA